MGRKPNQIQYHFVRYSSYENPTDMDWVCGVYRTIHDEFQILKQAARRWDASAYPTVEAKVRVLNVYHSLESHLNITGNELIAYMETAYDFRSFRLFRGWKELTLQNG